MVLLNSHFDTENAQHTGGVTGSARVKHKVKNIFYQLKPSILSNTLMRRFKAGHVGRENFGEVIASKISRSIMSGIDRDSVPEVSLVYNSNLKQVQIASKYLTGNKVRTLDSFNSNCCLDSSFCNVANLSIFAASGTCCIDAAGVPGLGLYLKEKHCPYLTFFTRSKVSAKSSSVSPGKPIIKSDECL